MWTCACGPHGRIDVHECLQMRCPRDPARLARIEADLTRREILGGTAAVMGMFAGFNMAPDSARAQGGGAGPQPILLTDLRLYDGRQSQMRADVDILIEGDRITGLPPKGQGPAEARRVDCGGRAVIPGLIDAHWHATMCGIGQLTAMTADPAYVHLVAAGAAGDTLMRGFTTVRDVGGPSFALKRAIDDGHIAGPRVFPVRRDDLADLRPRRFPHDPRAAPRREPPLSHAEEIGVSAIADGEDAVLMRAREQLMKGASQLKLMAGGGVSRRSTIRSTRRNISSANCARRSMRRPTGAPMSACMSIPPKARAGRSRAGVKCIEHGQLVDEDTVRMMADEGVAWSLQPFLFDQDANPKPLESQRAAAKLIAEGTKRAYDWAGEARRPVGLRHRHPVQPGRIARHGAQLAKLTQFYAPLDALHHATGAASDILAMSGDRAPYPGPVGVIEEGAMADILVIDGDPEASLDFLIEPDTTCRRSSRAAFSRATGCDRPVIAAGQGAGISKRSFSSARRKQTGPPSTTRHAADLADPDRRRRRRCGAVPWVKRA